LLAATRVNKLRRTGELRTQVAKCMEVDGGILETFIVNFNKFVVSVQQTFYLKITLNLNKIYSNFSLFITIHNPFCSLIQTAVPL
jgi:hypothetical protein